MAHNLNDRERRVVELWEQNATQREIANDLGVTLGVISGIAGRLKTKGVIKHRGKTQVEINCRRAAEVKIAALVDLSPEEAENLPAPAAEPLRRIVEPVIADADRPGVTIWGLERLSCRWVLPKKTAAGMPLYCGDVMEHRGFCAHHASIAFYLPRDFKPKTESQFKLRSILTAQFR